MTLGTTLSSMQPKRSVLMWGPEGTGKTTSALRMTKLCKKGQRVLLINAEGGAKVEALRPRGVDVDLVESWPPSGDPGDINYESLNQLSLDVAENVGAYVGTVWDSGTEITRRITEQVAAEARIRDRNRGKERGQFQVNLDDYGIASAMLRDLLRKFRDLPMHMVITALERRDVDDDTGKVRYGPAMQPSMVNDSAGLVDCVGDYVVDELGDERVWSAVWYPTRMRRAKDRYGLLPGKMVDPYFDRICGYIDGSITADNDTSQKRVRAMVQQLAGADVPATEKKEEAA